MFNSFSLCLDTKVAGVLSFFISNTVKTFILILVIGFIVGIARRIITPAKAKRIIRKKGLGVGNVLASLIGVITPVESFSTVPVFIGFLEGGIPLGIAFSYLVTAPMTNELAFALFWSLFGPKIAIFYYLAGIIIGITVGIIIGLLKLEKYLKPSISIKKNNSTQITAKKENIKIILMEAKNNSINFLKKMWKYIILGIAIAAIIDNYVPSEYLVKYIGLNNPFAIPLAVILVIFLYANIAMFIPTIIIFLNSGLPLGTILAFTMAVTATSVPELLILKTVLKLPLLLIYATAVLALIIFTGYLFNFAF